MKWQQIKWLPLLMSVTITGIAAFQVYWLQITYERERHSLEKSSNITFRETVHRLQAAKLRLDGVRPDSLAAAGLPATHSSRNNHRALPQDEMLHERSATIHEAPPNDKLTALVNVLRERLQDSTLTDTGQAPKPRLGRRSRLVQFLFDVDSLQDTLTLADIRTTLEHRMEQQNIAVPFTISRFEGGHQDDWEYNEVTLGFAHPITYRLELGNTTPYLMKRILAPVLLSVIIVGLTIVSFALLYRNLLRQRRLADIKNEFISNITHELKTPIATVGVAIEALRSFNADMDIQKSKEYLDISANELQRLSMLVDKVLKLSMLEKKGLDLKYETLDVKALVDEVTASMRLQAEKQQATIQVTVEGDTTVQGDRLHLVSVIYNLLDNALKYSNGAPVIAIKVKGSDSNVLLSITDNGIGIPHEYRDKIFDKFFRVPTGNLHNAKGYGLGLSYVAHVVRKHHGNINVKTAEGNGTCFAITLPKKAA